MKEVLKLALEALESDYVFEWPAMQRPERVKKKRFEAITAIKEALAQDEQEPVAWTPGPNLFKDWCSQYFGPDSDDDYLAKAVFNLPSMAQRFANTTSPKRPWAKLTDDDYEIRVSEEWKDGMSYAEAKLKEKNT